MRAVLVASAAMLGAGLLLKLCVAGMAIDVQRLCHSDLRMFFEDRGLARMPFPYVHGGLHGTQMLPGSIEYPVLTGVFAWLTARLAWSSSSFVAVSAIFLGCLAILTSHVLARMAGLRALLWAAAPPLALYAFHNWDLLAVGPAIAGMYCWWGDRPRWAAVLFGVGAAAKLYPAFFVLPLAVDAAVTAGVWPAVVIAAMGTGTFLLLNLPFMILNWPGWLATYQFHALRSAPVDSMWGVRLSWNFQTLTWRVEALNQITAALIAVSFVAVLAASLWRLRRAGTYPFLQTCAALVAAFLLWNKVHSPQYALWILPFFALVRVNRTWWAAYILIDATLYLSLFYLGAISLDHLASPYLQAALYARAALLLGLVVAFMMAEPAIVARPAREPALA